MNLSKKIITAMMVFCTVIFIGISQASAAYVDITISGLTGLDLGAFELTVNYDDTLLTFNIYTLTDELGSFTGPDPDYPDAEDWSLGDDTGTVHVAVTSYLWDFSSQSDDFTLATLIFSGDDTAIAAISLSDIILSDPAGNPISFTVNGTSINAVPVPAAVWLLGSALLGLVGVRRRKSI